MCKRICFQAYSGNSVKFRFNEGCTSATEGVQDYLSLLDVKFPDVLTNQMRREGKNKTIPVVEGAICGRHLVFITISKFSLIGDFFLDKVKLDLQRPLLFLVKIV